MRARETQAIPLTLKLLFRNDEHALIISSLLEAIFLHGYQEHGVKVRETVLRFRVNKYTPKALRLDSPLQKRERIWSPNASRNCFCDRYWGRAGQLLAVL